MGRKVFISILGTNYYVPVKYYFGQEPTGEEKITHFVQEATMGRLCKEWTENDAAYIFVTKDARDNNWQHPAQKGAYSGLSKIISDMNFDFKTEAIDIKDGFSENEIWDIFEAVFNKLEENDELYFDITHSFRSLPMLVMVLINYAKFLKDIKVEGIYYGAFEKLGPSYKVKEMDENKRFAPVLNLTAFSELQDWTSAAALFIKTGNTADIASLSDDEDLKKLLIQFSSIHTVVRGKDLYSGKIAKKISDKLENIENEIPPFSHIKDSLTQKVQAYKENDIINNGLSSIKFCIDHNLIQQGFTLLNEFIITYVLLKIDENWETQINRDIASGCMNISRKDNFDYTLLEEKLNKKVDQGKMSSSEKEKLLSLQKKIVDKIFELPFIKRISNDILKNVALGSRNDINHAGIRDKPKEAKEFAESLNKYYSKLQVLITKYE